MRALIIGMLAVFAGAAQAATSFDYFAATDGSYVCYSYCLGFATSDPDHTVDYVNVTTVSSTSTDHKFTISVDGVTYQGAAQDSTVPFVLAAVDGSGGSITATVTYASKRTCVRSGRGQHCTTRYFPNAGTVQL